MTFTHATASNNIRTRRWWRHNAKTLIFKPLGITLKATNFWTEKQTEWCCQEQLCFIFLNLHFRCCICQSSCCCSGGVLPASCCTLQPPSTCCTVQPRPVCTSVQSPSVTCQVQPPPITCAVKSRLAVTATSLGQPRCCCSSCGGPRCCVGCGGALIVSACASPCCCAPSYCSCKPSYCCCVPSCCGCYRLCRRWSSISSVSGLWQLETLSY